jgi:hypothetical protein
MSHLMCAMGYDIPHEKVGKDGAASWKHIVSGTFQNLKKNQGHPIDSEGFTRILHMVRHPMKVISSMQTFSASTWGYMAEHAPVDLKAPLAKRGMQAWVSWNQLVEQRAHWRFQIERLPEQFEEFCRQAGVPERPMPQLPQSATDTRVKRYTRLEWQDLLAAEPSLAEQVRELAAAYGYGDIANPAHARDHERAASSRAEQPVA